MKSLDSIISNITELVGEKETNIDKELLYYGLESLIIHILNIATILIIGLILNIFVQCILFLVIFSPLRVCAGGYHSQSKYKCYGVSSITIPILVLLVGYLYDNNMLVISLFLMVIAVITLYKYAPIETTNKLFDDEEYKHYRKKMLNVLIVYLFMIIVSIILNVEYLAILTCISIITSSILVIIEIINLKLKGKRKS